MLSGDTPSCFQIYAGQIVFLGNEHVDQDVQKLHATAFSISIHQHKKYSFLNYYSFHPWSWYSFSFGQSRKLDSFLFRNYLYINFTLLHLIFLPRFKSYFGYTNFISFISRLQHTLQHTLISVLNWMYQLCLDGGSTFERTGTMD